MKRSTKFRNWYFSLMNLNRVVQPQFKKNLGYGLLILVLVVSSNAQQNYISQGGHPSFATIEPVELGFVDVANGQLHLEIPIASFPQRGSLKYEAKLVYDSGIWSLDPNGPQWLPYNFSLPYTFGTPIRGGWRLITTMGGKGYAAGTQGHDNFCIDAQESAQHWVDVNPYIWVAPDGTQHVFDIFIRYAANPATCNPPPSLSGNALAMDGSGYHMYVTAGGGDDVIFVYAPDGTQVYPSAKDANGNFFSTDGSGNIVDTLSRTPIITTTSGDQTFYDVLNSQGSRSRFTTQTITLPANTNFGLQGASEFSGNFLEVKSLTLPNGTSYTFDYDSGTTPGHFGLLTSIVLPSGGQVNYSHITFQDPGWIYVAENWTHNKNRRVYTHTSAGATTYFTPAVLSQCPNPLGGGSCQPQVTVAKPTGDNTVYTYTFL